MRVLLQRVSRASVLVDGETVGSIGRGYVLFAGVLRGDTEGHSRWLAAKIAHLRLFEGENGTVNDRNILAIAGDVLVVSQFTLAGDVTKGNRPDYTAAEHPAAAAVLYQQFLEDLRAAGIRRVEAGVFGAHMEVTLVNDGPVTLLLERT